MVRESLLALMGLIIREDGAKISLMAMDAWNTLMEIDTMATGSKTL